MAFSPRAQLIPVPALLLLVPAVPLAATLAAVLLVAVVDLYGSIGSDSKLSRFEITYPKEDVGLPDTEVELLRRTPAGTTGAVEFCEFRYVPGVPGSWVTD